MSRLSEIGKRGYNLLIIRPYEWGYRWGLRACGLEQVEGQIQRRQFQ